MSDRDGEAPLEGEILPPNERERSERVTFRVVKIGWLGKIIMALAALGLIALALFISFWILVLLIPILIALAILGAIQRLGR